MSGPPHGFGKGVNDYLNHYINVADAKAGATVAADLTLATLLLSNLPTGGWRLCLGWLAIALFVVSAILGGLVVFPRRPSGRNGVIFWEDIFTRQSASDYLNDLKPLDANAVEEAYATQNWYVSQVLHSKYSLMQFCIGFFIAGIVPAAISVGGA